MNAICERCGGPIGRQQGPGGRRKMCERCSPKRDRPQRRQPTVHALPATPAPPAGPSPRVTPNGVAEATLQELQSLGMVLSWQGAAALKVAQRIDADLDSGGGLAALVKAHSLLMGDVRSAAPQPEIDDPLTRLRRIHAEREAQQAQRISREGR